MTRVVGHSLPRMDAPGKVTGAAVYAADFALPGMLYGGVLRSREPHARLLRIETSRAARLPGVRAIITAEAAYAFDIETAEGLARSYGQAETTWTLPDELQYLTRLRQVSAAQIQAAARKYLGDDNYARVRLRPAGAR
jgi:CO/xanthine dehydrogenase Mo-binding subunit